jgi:hypothetical protein
MYYLSKELNRPFMQAIENPDLGEVALEVQTRLNRVVDSL